MNTLLIIRDHGDSQQLFTAQRERLQRNNKYFTFTKFSLFNFHIFSFLVDYYVGDYNKEVVDPKLGEKIMALDVIQLSR